MKTNQSLSPAERNALNMADAVFGALSAAPRPSPASVPNLTEGCQPGCACRECQPSPVEVEMSATPQEAVVTLQHIINRFPGEPDVIFHAARAIADIATEAAENGTVVDPLLGSDFESPAQDTEAH